MPWRNLLNRVETARGLDRVGNPLLRVVQTVIRGRARDALHGVWLGHPLHPAIVLVPLSAWLSATVLDTLRDKSQAATAMVGLGNVSALPAVAAGLTDWSSLTREQRRVGLIHASANAIALSCYTASWAARRRGRSGRLLGYAGAFAMSAGAYLGGHLSYRQAAAVNQAEPALRHIPEGWHDLCSEADVRDGLPFVTQIGDVPVMVTRNGNGHGDGVTVMLEQCAHNTGPLAEGERVEIDGELCVVCPWHGSVFRLADGTVVHGPAATDQPLLRSRVVNGRVHAALP